MQSSTMQGQYIESWRSSVHLEKWNIKKRERFYKSAQLFRNHKFTSSILLASSSAPSSGGISPSSAALSVYRYAFKFSQHDNS